MTGSAADARAERRTWTLAALAAGAVAFLPFARIVASGSSFFFRDLSRYFIPMRLFVLEGLRRGEVRFWNPWDNEGIPLPNMPIGYPLELLQVLWPTAAGITVGMALHFPLAALAFVALARRLGLRPVAAAGGAVAYAIGGFALSMVNLYVYVHTLAWAPLVVWAGLRAADGGRRRLALAALVCGIALSTTGLELVLQTLVVAAALCVHPWDVRRPARLAASAALGLGLAAPVFTVLGHVTAGTARAAGFSANGVLNQSVHPLTFLQVVVGDLYGRLANVTNDWWGGRFFENGFPYVMSLYLGAATLALAAAGLASRRSHRRTLAAIAAVAAVVCLGRWIGWTPIVDAVPASLRVFRYPTKAFFSIHLVTALLAAYGLDAIAGGERRALRVLLACGSAASVLLLLAPAGPLVLPGAFASFQTRLFPASVPPDAAAAALDHLLRDAALGGSFALLVALLGWLVLAERVAGSRAALAAAALVAADLLRTGAALNPTIDVRLFQVAPGTMRLVETARPVRLHTCNLFDSPAYWSARAVKPSRHVVFTFLVMRDSLFPHFNVGRVRSALGEDLTGLVPARRTANGLTCERFDGMAERLRDAAVTHVASLEPLASAQLEPVRDLISPAIDPAVVHVYALREPRPRVELLGTAGSVRVAVEGTDALSLDVTGATDGQVLVRDGFGAGWRATVDGRDAPITEDAGHRRLSLPAGRHRVEMRYHPPGLAPGLAAFAASAAVVLFLALRPGTA